jgi:hypothetical protein
MIVINNLEVKQCKTWPNYAASKCGKIFRLGSGKEMSQNLRQGYMVVRTSHENQAKNTYVHKMVLDAWLEKPSDKHTMGNHKDGDKLNNNLVNLEWVTPSQNTRHAVDTGLLGKGSELYNGTLSNDDVHSICKMLCDGALISDLSKRFGVSKDIIRKIRAGDTYFHIRQLYNIDHKYTHDFSESTVKWVCTKIVEGFSDSGVVESSTNPNLTIIEIKRIRHKIRYKYISDLYF